MSFYSREKLIQMGMYSSCRGDTYFCVGKLLDKWKERGEISDEQFLEVKKEWEELNPNDPHDFVKKTTIERWLKRLDPIEEVNNKHGIYGIYSIRPDGKEQLVYIGKTETSFSQRFQEHVRGMKTGDSFVHREMKEYKELGYSFVLRPMVVIEDLKMDRMTITSKELKSMQLALITVFKPRWNVQGVLTPYCFTRKKSKHFYNERQRIDEQKKQ